MLQPIQNESHQASPTASQVVRTLKASESDFEWYPTTDEIIDCVKTDIVRHERDFECRKANAVSVLDCGAGDGRVLNTLTESSKYAIEKSIPLLRQLDKSIFIIGTDFYEQTLIDKKVDVLFSNPPYSEYVDWTKKIIRESNAVLVYLVIPSRWANNDEIMHVLKARSFEHKVIGEYDFSEADRKARAKVHVVRISTKHISRDDPFSLWFEESFANECDTSSIEDDIESVESRESIDRSTPVNGGDYVKSLVSIYQQTLANLLKQYRMIYSLDPDILDELDIKHSDIKEKLRNRITGLKDEYWREFINRIDVITSKLITSKRSYLINELTSHSHVDFTASNAYAVVIWVIKQANDYLDDQLIEVYENMIDRANIVLYKSNERTFGEADWRFNRHPENLTRYKLDYRIVLHHCGGLEVSEWSYRCEQYNGLSERAFNVLCDLMTVADNLGFSTRYSARPSSYSWESNKKVCLYARDRLNVSDIVLMEVKAFKNGNLHIKFNQKFICCLNVEFGRLKGWLRSKEQAESELDISADEAQQYFKSNHHLMTENVVPLLGFHPD